MYGKKNKSDNLKLSDFLLHLRKHMRQLNA